MIVGNDRDCDGTREVMERVVVVVVGETLSCLMDSGGDMLSCALRLRDHLGHSSQRPKPLRKVH